MDPIREEFSDRLEFLRQKLFLIFESYNRLEELRGMMQVIPFELDWEEFLCNLQPAIDNLKEAIRNTVAELLPGEVSDDSAVSNDSAIDDDL